MKKYTVTLTKDEWDFLKKITSKGKHKSQKVINALILLGCDEGEFQGKRSINEEISRVLKIGMRKIDRTKKRFVELSLFNILTYCNHSLISCSFGKVTQNNSKKRRK